MHTTAGTDAAIFIENVSVMVGKGDDHKALLRNISIAVPEGSFLTIIGASGSGKSVLIRTLAGIQPVSAGRVLLAGYPVETLREQLPLAVGYLPKFGAFHEDLTVTEILDFAMALRLPSSVPKTTRDQWREHVIDLARIRPILHQKYRTLSGGQMRRISMAEELIGDPAFLLLDEMTTGLDPYSEHEMMVWLKELAHGLKKTVVLVTHMTRNLRLCDSVIFLHEGRLCFHGPYEELLRSHGTGSVEAIFGGYEQASVTGDFVGFDADRSSELPAAPAPSALNTAPPPGNVSQLFTLIRRQYILLCRDRAQLWLHLSLLITFPLLVAIFATNGLPHIEAIQAAKPATNPLMKMVTGLADLKESFSTALLVSGLSMFQVILLTLMGANNGAREIAKERDVLDKELRAGLSPWSYVMTKSLLVVCLSVAQAFCMAWFVKTVCRFPGEFPSQFAILFATTLAMSMVCLAISSVSKSPERASLLANFLVGLQLPLSGVVLALPQAVGFLCRPFIIAYWGWSGYLKTLSADPLYDIVRESTDTYITEFNLCLLVLCIHVLAGGTVAWIFVSRMKRAAQA
ncbi:MAG TPA: ATP-binding cassette domain-containing protein [Candidatus Methylacidiphilales bacterium]|jgi:ABC-type multidrug transport system ATPase subunit|nr:ATP-binding cassette domain-containing protein [Candidatus Methylacidiphilales bacterium]